ncbi:MAG: cyclophane-forming radical SAM/SPASM peptide maturase GrrM/OscB [Minisyncoccia bacterium]
MWRPRLIVLQPTPYCNINCDYCYLQNRNDPALMPRAVIEAIKNKMFARLASDAEPTVVWHAGEPTAAPISWYEHAYSVLRPLSPAGTTFSMQSNGVSLSDKWIDFLKRSNTRIGLSIDGPQRFHDLRRKTRAGRPTWELVIRNLHRLQAAQLHPTVISVLHPTALSAAEEYYQFYRDNDIHQISFSIDEAEGANATSSFEGLDHKQNMIEFLRTILRLAFSEGYSLYVREIERIAYRLAEGGAADNEQVEPWQIVVVAANGDVTTFSPEFMELRSAEHNNFCFGNILRDDFDDLPNNAFFQRARDEISAGVELCRNCRYFGICGGGAPSNKMFENKTLASAETSFCRLSVQSAADALVGFLSESQQAGPNPAFDEPPATGARPFSPGAGAP